jgi:hypothetical protein
MARRAGPGSHSVRDDGVRDDGIVEVERATICLRREQASTFSTFISVTAAQVRQAIL